nr:NADH dehydrogenase subunit 6 [Idiacanthus fasciola]
MTYFLYLFLVSFIAGLMGVASSPAPYFAALGLVVAAGAGAGVMIVQGGAFLSLVLFLIYLGGMVVVFAYSAALAAEPFPETLGSPEVLVKVIGYGGLMMALLGGLSGGWYEGSWVVVDELKGLVFLRGDTCGVAWVYLFGGKLLLVCGWFLFVTLFVVLELTRGGGRGALRAV